jgi:PDDEXK-like domain of unknown function (DUF3799)
MTALATEIAFETGLYPDMPEDVYHADPVPGGSLSASGAKLLLPPSCPALYRYRREHPKVSAAFDYGTAAHKYVLGQGPPVTVVEGDRWDTNAAKEKVAAIRAVGGIALKQREMDQVEAMADAIRRHPLASALLNPEHGDAEQSLFWADDATGVTKRARLDWLPRPRPARRLIITDYKTCDKADTASATRAIANFGYYISAAQYIDGVRALGLDDDPAFLFIFQEKAAPYLVHVIGLDDKAITAGRERMQDACEIWRDCTESGFWPGYPDDITYISLPPWAERRAEDFS